MHHTLIVLASLTISADPTPQELVRRYDAVMSPTNFAASSSMTAHREDGTTRTYKMQVLKSGKDKFRATFQEPATAKGQEMLRNGDNLWLYMPNLKRSVRVASRDSFMGGDFNNADALRVNYEADYEPTIEKAADGAPILMLKAKTPSAAYDVIKLWMTAGKEPQPLRAEYYAASGKLLRSAEFSDVKDFGKGLVRPSRMTMKNELQKERWSEMVWEKLDLKTEISTQRFVVDDLGR